MGYNPKRPVIDPTKAVTVTGQKPLPKADKPVPKTFTPVSNIIAGWVEPKDEATKGGVLLGAAAATYTTPVVRIVAVGPDCKFVKPGDRVLAVKADFAVYVGEHAYCCMFEEGVIGVLPPVAETNETTAQPVA